MESGRQRFGENAAQGPSEGTPQRADLPGQNLFLSQSFVGNFNMEEKRTRIKIILGGSI
jgi:hypothetical protein